MDLDAITADPGRLRFHGDDEMAPGLADFAVNVHGDGPPSWLQKRLSAVLPRLGEYPGVAADLTARTLIAERHGRSPDEVLLLAGGAEGFSLLAALTPHVAAVVNPSFTEPEWVLRRSGVEVEQVVLAAPYSLESAAVSERADMVVVGNPTNPTSVLHSIASIDELRRPGRIVVVDEAFMDVVPGEPESLAPQGHPDVLVLRSLTKTWALAGLRCGYAVGHPDVLRAMHNRRPHWPLGSLQIEALIACNEPAALVETREIARTIAADRLRMSCAITALGIDVHSPAAAPFLLLHHIDGHRIRIRLRELGIAVRRCDTFPGLTPNHFRVAVRPEPAAQVLIDALKLIVSEVE